MKRSIFISTVIISHIVAIFLHIHTHTQFIKQSFIKQKNERLYDQLLNQKQTLINTLCLSQNHASIKTYAQEHLHMKPVRLDQIKHLPHHDTTI